MSSRWREERDRVRAYIEERCWSDELGAYVEYAGGDTLDAAVLRGARMGWDAVSARPARARTVDAIRERLDAGGGLLWRRTGNIEQEGAFVACSFWLVEALARAGDVDEAAALFEQLPRVRERRRALVARRSIRRAGRTSATSRRGSAISR